MNLFPSIFSFTESIIGDAFFNNKSDDIRLDVKVSLSDVYLGKKEHLVLHRQTICTHCSGRGSSVTACAGCHGERIQLLRVQIFPGHFQQIPQECQRCMGTGVTARSGCLQCSEMGVVTQHHPIQLDIPKDTQRKHRIILEGFGHHLPRKEPGDAVITFHVEPHPVFIRRGANLFMHKEIQLSEAICGLETQIETLDGRKLFIRSNPGDILKPRTVRCVHGEGMPIIWQNSNRPFGDLYIKFDVIFPSSLEKEAIEKLKDNLPESVPCNLDRMREDVDEAHLVEYDPNERHAMDGTDDEDSRDDFHDIGPGIQCAHQ